MQNRSRFYREMMRSDWRDVAKAEIYIGAINQRAQKGAKASADFWKFASPQTPLMLSEEVKYRYFAWEEKTNCLDGSMLFVPEADAEAIYNNGIVTESISTEEAPQDVYFIFETPDLDIKGLTIDFGISYPLTFKVETNTGIVEYETESRNFMTEDVFTGISYMRIIPGRLSQGKTRFRIEKVLFGIGVVLQGYSRIINLDIKERVHPLSLDLPAIDLSFTINNLDRCFNANADTNVINFLEKGQIVKVYFYQTLANGNRERIIGTAAMLESWKDKTNQAEFSATDRLWQLDGIYEDGVYRKDGIPAYDLLKDVFIKAGLSLEDYFIDPYLQGVILYNPLPRDTYANCILLIANACRCIMCQDREMKIIIKASFVPELTTSASAGAEFSQAERLLEHAEVTEYFDWQQSYNRIDGEMFWKPEGEEANYTAYVSKALSDSEGYFLDNPCVVIKATAAFTFYQLSLVFGEVYPLEALIHCYNNGTETECFNVEIFGKEQIIHHAFMDVDKVTVEFTKAHPFNRVSIQNISVAETTDFVLERENMMEEPEIERQDRIKDIIVVRTVYMQPEETSVIFSDQTIISAEREVVKLEFNDASIPVLIRTIIPASTPEAGDVEVDYGAEILQYSNWYCIICFKNPPEQPVKVQLEVTGYVYKIINPKFVHSVSTTGITPDALENPLIDTVEMASGYAAWCAEYYAAKAEYTFPKYMGDPVLEANDLAYYEDENNKQQLIRVHTVQLKFDGTYNDSSCAGRSL